MAPGSVLYNASTVAPCCVSSSDRSSWIYLHMDSFQHHDPLGHTAVLNLHSHCAQVTYTPGVMTPMDTDGSDDSLSWSLASPFSSASSTSSSSSSASSRLGGWWRGWLSSTPSTMSSSSSSSSKSSGGRAVLADTATELWKDNPERDPFSTFCVSRQDLTCAIAHLETQLYPRLSPAPPYGEQGPTPNPASAASKAELPTRLKFILDSYCNVFWMRKQDLRELKLLQKQENKQYQDLLYKNQVATDAQERKFEVDMQTLTRNYEQDMETLTKQQKQAVEKQEKVQQHDMKSKGKDVSGSQEKELKSFRDKQKQEMKLLKQELNMLPKGENKKENIRKALEAKEIELQEKERVFLETQAERLEIQMRQLADIHRQKIAMLEKQFLQQKQQLLRAREAAVWEMEKEQLHEKHQLAKGQLKDMFFLKRHQMLTRHQKEMDQMKRYNSTKEEEMQARHTLEKRRLPKILKAEAKTRALMFKQSLRLSTFGTPDDDKVKIKQFEENEKKRMKAEQERQDAKHKKQWGELVYKNESSLRELEQLQAEKRKLLMEQETQKIKELDEQYANELKEWKAQLVPRKQKLEEEFLRQKDEQEKFYGASQAGEGEGSDVTHMFTAASSASVRSKDSTSSMSSRHSTVI